MDIEFFDFEVYLCNVVVGANIPGTDDAARVYTRPKRACGVAQRVSSGRLAEAPVVDHDAGPLELGLDPEPLDLPLDADRTRCPGRGRCSSISHIWAQQLVVGQPVAHLVGRGSTASSPASAARSRRRSAATCSIGRALLVRGAPGRPCDARRPRLGAPARRTNTLVPATGEQVPEQDAADGDQHHDGRRQSAPSTTWYESTMTKP